MERLDKVRLTRRDMLKLSGAGAGVFALTASGFAVPRGFAGGGGGGGSLYLEAFPTSPVITAPFMDELVVPKTLLPTALKPSDISGQGSWARPNSPTPLGNEGPRWDLQDNVERPAGFSDKYSSDYSGKVLGQHQIFPGKTDAPITSNGTPYTWGTKDGTAADPLVYRITVEVGGHDFTKSPVLPINSFGKPVIPPKASGVTVDPKTGTAKLPQSTIYGFNGTFPGPRINAQYGQAALVRFENHLDKDNGFDRQDFGTPGTNGMYTFLTHLHNGHTAPESDGQPHYASKRFEALGREHDLAAFAPGEWVDQMYLGYPAGGDECEKQSFFWFHDHVHGFTGANVYKGMVGLMPIYDPVMDTGNETEGYRLPGVRIERDMAGNQLTKVDDKGNPIPGSAPKSQIFDVEYDIPMALYDCRLDDGLTPHKDFHNGSGETQPGWWGKTFFRHFPNHGFVGDVFTVNGTAYPVLHVKRRKYRLRFLDASISRIYELQLMHSPSNQPKAAYAMGYKGDDLQGQYRLPDASQCMEWVQVANEGGVLPNPIYRDSFELWPAKRKEFLVDFTQYMDGTPTSAGDVIWLVNTMKMTTGRMWDSKDPNYKVPLVKIVIGEDAPDQSMFDSRVGRCLDLKKDRSLVETCQLRERPQPVDGWKSAMASAPTFELQRGSATGQPETEWLINGQPFISDKPLISVEPNSGAVWRIKNGGGGWVHPMHLHMEEHLILMRNGKSSPVVTGQPSTDKRCCDDTSKEDVIALDPSEDTYISRRFRTFVGPYVAHCHNLAHEDHNMMFGWEIKKKQA